MNEQALVVKDNRMIEASYTLSVVEQRIILMAIAWARDHTVQLSHETWVELRATDYSRLYDVDLVIAYRQLKIACESLQERKITIKGVDPETRAPATYQSRWVNPAVYVDTVGLVRLRFDEVLVPYVSNLESHFTSYNLGSVCGLSSGYAFRLYELLSQYKKVGKRKIMIGTLKDYLECNSPSYDRLDNFKRRVIDPAVEQINVSTDLSCTYTTEKSGKRVIAFDFSFTVKKTIVQSNLSGDIAKRATLRGQQQVPSLAERAILRQLQQKHPTLTLDMVLSLAKNQKTDLFMALHQIEQQGLP